jgi:branched-chain amino acid transport system ATP-binding protein
MTDATATAAQPGGRQADGAGDVLDAVDVTAGYGRNMVLRDVTVRVRQGEFVSLIGANGAGKSTLFKCLGGHVRPRSGRVRLFGEDLGGKAPHEIVRAGLGEVPEGRHVFPGLSVREHLQLAAAFGARARGEDAASLTARVHELFPLLRDRGAQAAGTMSGGQQQMLVIGRALMTRPRALMLDEPSLGLAPLAVEGIFTALRELNRSGVAVLLIEQNAMAALRLADRAYVLQNGRVVREGSGAELASDRALIEHYVGGAT